MLNRHGDARKRAPIYEIDGALGVTETDNTNSGVLAHSDDRHRQPMNTQVLLADAVRILNSEVREWKAAVSQRLLWLIHRKVKEISPAELLAALKKWRTCRTCWDSGIIGSPLKRTLNFCDCEIGQQERLDRSDRYIASEIERVNATLKSRLVQACRELKHDFTGDAIEQSDTSVTEHDDFIEIHPGLGAERSCDEQDLGHALEYFGDTRRVRVDHPEHEAKLLATSSGIEASELAHAPRSIVESVRCNDCGGGALVRYTDGTIEGCGCRNKRGGNLDRIPASSALGIRSYASAHRRSASE